MTTAPFQAYAALEDGLKINRFLLDEELVAQPSNYFEAARGRAMAISKRDKARDIRERTKAAAYNRIRANLEKAGSKVTEAMVNNEMILDKDVQEAEEGVRDSVETADLWEALTQAWMQRSYALKDLVQLHVTAYSQTPSSTGGAAATARESEYASNRKAIAEARSAKGQRARI